MWYLTIPLLCVLLVRAKFKSIEVEVHRAEDAGCYNMSIGTANFTFDYGVVRSCRNSRKSVARFRTSEDALNMSWITKFRLYIGYYVN